jgi:hypothetical protein
MRLSQRRRRLGRRNVESELQPKAPKLQSAPGVHSPYGNVDPASLIRRLPARIHIWPIRSGGRGGVAFACPNIPCHAHALMPWTAI